MSIWGALAACATAPASRPGPIVEPPAIAADDYQGLADAALRDRDHDALKKIIEAWFAAAPTDLRVRTLHAVNAQDDSYTHELVRELAASPDVTTWRGRIAFADDKARGGWKLHADMVAYAWLLLENGNHADALILARQYMTSNRLTEELLGVVAAIQSRAGEELALDAQGGPASPRSVSERVAGRANTENAWLYALAGDMNGYATSVQAAMAQHEASGPMSEVIYAMFERKFGDAVDDRVLRELWESRHRDGPLPSRPGWSRRTAKTNLGSEAFCLALLRMRMTDAAMPHCARLWPKELNSASIPDFIGDLALNAPQRLAPYGLTPESVFAVQNWVNVSPVFARSRAEWLSRRGDWRATADAFRNAVRVPSTTWSFTAQMRLALALHDGPLLRALAERPPSRRGRLFMDGLLALASRDEAVAQVAIETLTRAQEGVTDMPRAVEILVEIRRAIDADSAVDDMTVATAVLSIATHFGQHAGPEPPVGDSQIATLARRYRD